MGVTPYIAGNKAKIEDEEELFFEGYELAENITAPIPLDFVQLEFVSNSMRERSLRAGVRL